MSDQAAAIKKLTRFFEKNIDLNSVQESLEKIDSLRETNELYHSIEIEAVDSFLDKNILACEDFLFDENVSDIKKAHINLDKILMGPHAKEFIDTLGDVVEKLSEKSPVLKLHFYGITITEKNDLESKKVLTKSIVADKPHTSENFKKTLTEFTRLSSRYNQNWDIVDKEFRGRFPLPQA